jgi:hypothetical protein
MSRADALRNTSKSFWRTYGRTFMQAPQPSLGGARAGC